MSGTTGTEIQLINGKVKDSFLTGLLLIFVHLLSCATAHADFSALGVTPTRVVITENQKSGSINLHNSSSKEITYRMRVVEMGLDSDGRFRELGPDELPAGHLSSAPIVRFSPRQVRLAPGASQVIRVIVRRRAASSHGEYRSHLNIQALPIVDDSALGDLASDKGDVTVLLASSPTTVGITIPVIVRHGQTSASVSIDQVHYPVDSDGMVRRARVRVGRKGNRSVYGEIQLLSSKTSDPVLLGSIRGYAIYHPYDKEWIDVLLRQPLEADQLGARPVVRVRFIDGEDPSRGDEILTDTEKTVRLIR